MKATIAIGAYSAVMFLVHVEKMNRHFGLWNI